MKFLIDMNLSPLWVSFLAERDSQRSIGQQSVKPWAADSEIFDFAAANEWIVFTHDLDFGMLLAALRTRRPSVIQVRTQDVLPSAIGDIGSGQSRPLNQTSKLALSLPSSPSVIAFECYRSE
jgi:predicted nuclease of predicted toxin-antitoxin system